MKARITQATLVVLFMVTALQGAGHKGIGVHAAPFLRISPSARQVALGEAFAALADDINLLRYNVGGLGNIDRVMLAVNFHNWIDDTHQGAVGLALPSRFGVLGFDFTYFNEGQIEVLDESFRKTGATTLSEDFVFSAAYGSGLQWRGIRIAFGAAFRLLRQNLVGERSSASAIDLGAHLRHRAVSLAATVQNIGFDQVRFKELESSLPRTLRLGAAIEVPFPESARLALAADAAWTRSQSMRSYLGGELVIGELIALRAGYQVHHSSPSPFSAGFGLYIPMAWLARSLTRFDYAYSPLEDFETTAHRFSLLFNFNAVGRSIDRGDLAALNERLRRELEAAEKARLALQESEARSRQLEKEMADRLAKIKRIAAESDGKIEVEPQTPKRILISMRINFEFDRASVRLEDHPTLERVAEILNTYPEAQVHVSGHTDSIGSEQYNIRLSQRRVDSVLVFLSDRGEVSASRFYMPVGYGELRPIASNADEEGRFRNRRVEFTLFTYDAVPDLPRGSGIQSIQTVDDRTVRIICNGQVEFKVSRLNDPERLVIDIPDVYLLTGRTRVPINRGPFIRARLGFHPQERYSRVVFDLQRSVETRVSPLENMIVIRSEE